MANGDYRAKGRVHDMRSKTAKTKAPMTRVNKRGQVVNALTKKYGMKNPKKRGLGAKMRSMATAQNQQATPAQSSRSGGIGGMVRQAVAHRQASLSQPQPTTPQPVAPASPASTPAKGGVAGLVGQAVKAQQGAKTASTPAATPAAPAAPTTPARPAPRTAPSTSGFRQRR